MDCIKAEELLSDFIENELSEKLHLEVKEHLTQCQSCNKLSQSIKNLIINGSKLSEELPFYLKNRLLYIPELIELKEEEPDSNQGIKFIAAMIGTVILLLNIFYFTNIYPKGHYFLHKTISKVERFAIDTKTYIFQKESIKNNFLISFLDKNLFSNYEENYLKLNTNIGDENG